MINVGIVGYGNLGKAVEKELINQTKYNLVGIFSRRKLNKNNAYLYKQAADFENKIDIMIMCGGSEKDLPMQSKEMAKIFSIIDTFDTHQKIINHYQSINKICNKNNKSAIVSCGWDPGLFSIIRVLYSNIFQSQECFYGKGVSMGHTNALKRIKHVKNALQYTIPNKKAIKLAKRGQSINIPKHFRLCYVVANKNKKEIKSQIKSIPNYFQGEKTKIKFIGENKLTKKHSALYHQGNIFSVYKNNKDKISSNFSLKTTSNPLLTAKIIITYLNALTFMIENNINTALTPIQIPPIWLTGKTESESILNFC